MSYVRHAINLVSNTEKISPKTLNTIKLLDDRVSILSKILDDKRKLYKNSNSNELSEEINKLSKFIEDLTDRKAQLAVSLYDLIDHNVKIVDEEINLIQKVIILNSKSEPDRLQYINSSNESKEMKKRIFSNIDNEEVAVIDPNEPIYCFCRQVAYGEMIACDNEECDIEWFHYACVNLTKKPRNIWLCPSCSSQKKK